MQEPLTRPPAAVVQHRGGFCRTRTRTRAHTRTDGVAAAGTDAPAALSAASRRSNIRVFLPRHDTNAMLRDPKRGKRARTSRDARARRDEKRFHVRRAEPVTERVVLLKHPFHLCLIPALGRDGGVGRLGDVQRGG